MWKQAWRQLLKVTARNRTSIQHTVPHERKFEHCEDRSVFHTPVHVMDTILIIAVLGFWNIAPAVYTTELWGCLLPQHSLAWSHWYNTSKIQHCRPVFLCKTLIFHCFWLRYILSFPHIFFSSSIHNCSCFSRFCAMSFSQIIQWLSLTFTSKKLSNVCLEFWKLKIYIQKCFPPHTHTHRHTNTIASWENSTLPLRRLIGIPVLN